MKFREIFSKYGAQCQDDDQLIFSDVFWSWFGVVVGVGACALLSSWFFEPQDLTLMIGSMGASAVLVYGAPHNPLSQPRNLIGGHMVSALVGVICYQCFGVTLWLAAALSVSFALVAMLLTKTLHPPGGATALIAVIGDAKIHKLGFLYVLLPAAASAAILCLIALLVNNLPSNRCYPKRWF
jgi:CBS-domain-containing membrane protein